MITKFETYNEGIKHLLNGPTKEEAWKSLGFDRTFETPEEYFLYLTDGVEIVSPNGLYYEWKKGDKILFEQYPTPDKLFFMKYSDVKIFDKIFDMNFREFFKFSNFIKEMINKYFGNNINISEYQIRIEYRR